MISNFVPWQLSTNIRIPPNLSTAVHQIIYDTGSLISGVSLPNPSMWNHNVGSGNNRLLFCVLCIGVSGNGTSGSSVTSNGLPFTRSWIGKDGNWSTSEGWYLINPDIGNNRITASYNDINNKAAVGAISLFEVDQINPIRYSTSSFSTNTGTYTGSVSISSSLNDFMVSGFVSDWNNDFNPQGNNITRWKVAGLGSDQANALSTDIGTGNVMTMSWTSSILVGGSNYAMGAVSVIPA